MPSTPTTRFGLVTEADGDALVSAAGRFRTLATAIDTAMFGYLSGTLASIPGAGVAGRTYRTTDTAQWFFDNGSAWVEIAQKISTYAEVNNSDLAPNGPIFGDPSHPGPSITLTVPTNGLVSIFAAMSINNNSGNGAAAWLLEDGVQVGLTPLMQAVGLYSGQMYSSPGYVAGGALDNTYKGTPNRAEAGWVTFPATVGAHVYKLVYAKDPASIAAVNTRRLWGRIILP